MTQATEKDIGKWCKFYWYGEIKMIAKLDLIDDYYYPSNKESAFIRHNNCTPLTQEQIKVLGLEEQDDRY